MVPSSVTVTHQGRSHSVIGYVLDAEAMLIYEHR